MRPVWRLCDYLCRPRSGLTLTQQHDVRHCILRIKGLLKSCRIANRYDDQDDFLVSKVFKELEEHLKHKEE